MVDTLLSARPVGGFKESLYVGSWTLEGYVVRNLHHHVKESLRDGEVPAFEWLTNKDHAILQELVTLI